MLPAVLGIPEAKNMLVRQSGLIGVGGLREYT